jgi:hypothetical protein
MPANEYQFLTRWRVRATREEAADIVSDALALPRWWPAVYLAVAELEPGDEAGVGKVIDLHTKGWLPYTLRWRFKVTESDYPERLAIEAEGDFIGTGLWTFTQDGAFTDVTYDWRIRADKGLLRRLSWLMKPIFAANHRWAMEKGRQSLELELLRRRLGEDERGRIADPPGPTSARRQAALAACGLLAVAAAAHLAVRGMPEPVGGASRRT